MSERKPSKVSEISVVVPVRNEGASIRGLIEGLMNQTLVPAEIVFTDGGSIDNTREIIEEFIEKGEPIKLIRETFSLPGRSRNIGAGKSHSEWIAFTDAGTRPEPSWLAELAAPVDSSVDVVYGSYEPAINSLFEECAAIAYVPPRLENGARPYSIVSALMKRKVWEQVGGFPEDLRSAEDLLFIREVERSGFRIARAPKAIVHWSLQPNLWRTFRRFVAYARNNIRAGLWREWQLAIFLRYALLLLSTIPAAFIGWWWLGLPAGLWLGMMFGRAMKSILQNRIGYPASVPRNVSRLFILIPILAAIDTAAFVGSIDWLLRDSFGRGKTSR